MTTTLLFGFDSSARRADTVGLEPPLDRLANEQFEQAERRRAARREMQADHSSAAERIRAWERLHKAGKLNEVQERFWHEKPAEELYDLSKDPEQVVNVAADPAYAGTKKELSERLLKVLTDAGDPRVQGDGGVFDRPPFSDPEVVPARRNAAKRNGNANAKAAAAD